MIRFILHSSLSVEYEATASQQLVQLSIQIGNKGKGFSEVSFFHWLWTGLG